MFAAMAWAILPRLGPRQPRCPRPLRSLGSGRACWSSEWPLPWSGQKCSGRSHGSPGNFPNGAMEGALVTWTYTATAGTKSPQLRQVTDQPHPHPHGGFPSQEVDGMGFDLGTRCHSLGERAWAPAEESCMCQHHHHQTCIMWHGRGALKHLYASPCSISPQRF